MDELEQSHDQIFHYCWIRKSKSIEGQCSKSDMENEGTVELSTDGQYVKFGLGMEPTALKPD